ncbi:MAG: hypothetical protein MI861_22755, partial [Pirellulales bacterium]|nr:hypothetical protein [Pirellulales bacterium]
MTSINTSSLWDLENIYRDMGQHDHIEANQGVVCKGSENGQVSHTKWYKSDGNRTKARRFSKGVAAVRNIVALSVGERKADEIMKQVMGKNTRSDGFESYWNPRKTAMSKQQLGDILTAAHEEVDQQMLHIKDQRALLAELYQKQDFSQVNLRAYGSILPVQDVLDDPRLSKYLREHCVKENQTGYLDFLRECEKLDKLADQAENLLKKKETANPEQRNQLETDLEKLDENIDKQVKKICDGITKDNPDYNFPGYKEVIRKKYQNFNVKNATCRQVREFFGKKPDEPFFLNREYDSFRLDAYKR